MTESRNDHNSSGATNEFVRVRYSDIDFPSDYLSVKRLRTMFEEMFDNGSDLTGGFSYFFDPAGVGLQGDDEPAHLVQLNNLIYDERHLADYAFYNAIDPYPSITLNEQCKMDAEEYRRELEQLYQRFKLADSPETAKLLVRQVEEQAAKQGEQIKSRSR